MGDSPHVLAVDDERLMRMAYRHRLAELGYHVDVARSVDEAMDLLDRGRYDVVVTDLAVGEGSGLDLIAYARRVASGIKAILLVGSRADLDEEEALRAGADAVLVKPCSLLMVGRETHRVLGIPSDDPG